MRASKQIFNTQQEEEEDEDTIDEEFELQLEQFT